MQDTFLKHWTLYSVHIWETWYTSINYQQYDNVLYISCLLYARLWFVSRKLLFYIHGQNNNTQIIHEKYMHLQLYCHVETNTFQLTCGTGGGIRTPELLPVFHHFLGCVSDSKDKEILTFQFGSIVASFFFLGGIPGPIKLCRLLWTFYISR